MKRKLLLTAVIIPLLITACSSSNSEEKSSSVNTSAPQSEIISSEPTTSSEDVRSEDKSSEGPSSSKEDKPVPSDTYRLNFEALLLKDEEDKPLDIQYDIPKAYLSFDHASTTFKKELAIAASSFIANAHDEEEIKKVYQFFEFDDFFASEDYKLDETATTVKCFIGHKHYQDYELINISVNGLKYMKPWQSNFNIGQDGAHAGFKEGSDKLLPMIANYLNKYKDASKVKLFVNGYSRSAAICNMACAFLIDSKVIKEENLYAYLFETPRGIPNTNTNEYKSIFNIINSADLVTYVAPNEYGLKRVGVDVEIYKDNADEILKAFDERINIGTFTPKEKDPDSETAPSYANDVEFTKYLISYLLEPVDPETLTEDTPLKDISTRENFVNNVSGDIGFLASFFLSLPSEVVDAIMAKIKAAGLGELMGLLSPDGIYNFILPILQEKEVVYEEEPLKAALNGLLYLVINKQMILLFAMDETSRADLMRSVYFHALETVVPLLIAL